MLSEAGWSLVGDQEDSEVALVGEAILGNLQSLPSVRDQVASKVKASEEVGLAIEVAASEEASAVAMEAFEVVIEEVSAVVAELATKIEVGSVIGVALAIGEDEEVMAAVLPKGLLVVLAAREVMVAQVVVMMTDVTGMVEAVVAVGTEGVTNEAAKPEVIENPLVDEIEDTTIVDETTITAQGSDRTRTTTTIRDREGGIEWPERGRYSMACITSLLWRWVGGYEIVSSVFIPTSTAS